METGEVDSRFGNRGRESGDEIQRLEDHMSSAVAEWGLQLVAHFTSGGDRQTMLGDGRPGDVATQPFNLISLVGSGGHPGMETEAVEVRHPGWLWVAHPSLGVQRSSIFSGLASSRCFMTSRMSSRSHRLILRSLPVVHCALILQPLSVP